MFSGLRAICVISSGVSFVPKWISFEGASMACCHVGLDGVRMHGRQAIVAGERCDLHEPHPPPIAASGRAGRSVFVVALTGTFGILGPLRLKTVLRNWQEARGWEWRLTTPSV